MKYSAKINVEEGADLMKCFHPEKFEKERSSYKIKRIKNAIVFEIKARDIAALRATMNSITQLLSVYERMKQLTT